MNVDIEMVNNILSLQSADLPTLKQILQDISLSKLTKWNNLEAQEGAVIRVSKEQHTKIHGSSIIVHLFKLWLNQQCNV